MEDYNFIYNASIYPGIILAIDKNDFPETNDYTIDALKMWGIVLHPSIPANKLYIRIEEKMFRLVNELFTDPPEWWVINNLLSVYINTSVIRHRCFQMCQYYSIIEKYAIYIK